MQLCRTPQTPQWQYLLKRWPLSVRKHCSLSFVHYFIVFVVFVILSKVLRSPRVQKCKVNFDIIGFVNLQSSECEIVNYSPVGSILNEMNPLPTVCIMIVWQLIMIRLCMLIFHGPWTVISHICLKSKQGNQTVHHYYWCYLAW